ncbi:MAG: retroviral-like aspartic protease family protein [Planctomycetes bacterium]|nr:retroviral-like aspartic protease family protein [Planctomycetota bacterium]
MIYFDSDVQGKTIEFLLDTGNTHQALSRSTAKRFTTEQMELGVSGDIREIRSNSMIEVVTLKNFQLGRVHVALAQFPVGDTSLIGLKVLNISSLP